MSKVVEILVPCYNEAEGLPLFYAEVCRYLDELTHYEFYFLFVDDGSTDGTMECIKKLSECNSNVRWVSLLRNFGKEAAMLAGFDYSQGDAVIIMDADLQDTPSLITQLLHEWELGYEDVYAKRINRRGEKWLKKISAHLYYKVLQKVSDVEILVDVGDFRLLDKRCIAALRKLREKHRYTKGLFCWIGFKKKAILYDRAPRIAGHTHWNYWQLIKLGVNGIVSFSTMPLHVSIWIGIAISLGAFLFMIYIVISTLLYGNPVEGYPSMISIMLFVSGIQLILLGVIGEYIGKLVDESKGRPVYLVGETNIE